MAHDSARHNEGIAKLFLHLNCRTNQVRRRFLEKLSLESVNYPNHPDYTYRYNMELIYMISISFFTARTVNILQFIIALFYRRDA